MNTYDPIAIKILTTIANLNLPPVRYTTDRQRKLNRTEKNAQTTAIYNNQKNAI